MTYEAKQYPTQAVIYRSGAHRRRWLLFGGALAAVLAMLILIVAVYQAPGDEPVAAAGAGSPTTPSAEPTHEPTATDQAAVPGPVSESGGGSSGSGEVDSEDADETGGEDAEESEDEGEAEEPVAPLKIDATINSVTPVASAPHTERSRSAAASTR